MLTAAQALQASLERQLVNLKPFVDYLDEAIRFAASEGRRWVEFDMKFEYDFGFLSHAEERILVDHIRELGYGVERKWGGRDIIIRW